MIENLDRVLARSEDDPAGPLRECLVEELFERQAALFDLRVGGRTIRTTAEHPFWVEGRGWVLAGSLVEGDQLVSHDGRILTLDGVSATGELATVYNVRVADYHTYFVGAKEWGFSVWVHNQYDAGLAQSRKELGLPAAGSAQDAATLARLEVGGESFLGISGHGLEKVYKAKGLKASWQSLKHAEGDAFGQALMQGVQGGNARLVTDRRLCHFCGERGGLGSMARALGLESLEIVTPLGSKTIYFPFRGGILGI